MHNENETGAAPAAPAVTVSPAPRVETIDTPEFSHVLCDLIDAVNDMATSEPFDRARAKLVEFVDAALARQAQPTDRDAVRAAAEHVMREALDNVSVHPCDRHNDDARARQLSPLMQNLFRALKGKSGSEGAAS